MIEILITLLVVSVGLLGTASLQLLSKRSIFDAAQRTTAANLSEDLLERMRSNPAALINYMNASPLGAASAVAPGTDCGNAAGVCTPAELARYDLWQWEQQLDGALETVGGAATGGLVSPTACVQGPGFGGSGTYSISIAWRGLTESVNAMTDNCGQGSGLYGAGDKYRRVLVIDTYINAG